MALEDIQRMQMVQEAVQSPNTRRDDLQVMGRGSQGLQPMSPGAMGGSVPVQEQPVDISRSPTPTEIKEGAFNAAFENLARRAGVDLVGPIKEVVQVAQLEDTPQNLPAQTGLIGKAMGGRFDGRVPGQGHGMQDNVYMPIKEEGQQIATLAVSPKEYVVDAHTMSAIGNGNADAGADVMDKVVESIREKAFGTDQQPNEINGLAALRPMIERV